MTDTERSPSQRQVEQTVDVVSAYVANNSLPIGELPALIASIYQTLGSLGGAPVVQEVETVEKPTPAQIRKSIRPDGLISFIDGKSYKTLKRHLTKHGLDPHSYRERYGLPADYPTTAANYSAQRSALAKELGLGQPARASDADDTAETAKRAPRRKGAAGEAKTAEAA
ncbi:MucR family transcriptional regulator [Methylobacterium sp. sgz302541]|uniref:MucR family transcriptional regulator n=1 Tax=unclassified Methylobacterium TaxID=2615210 RepID=UPI003D331125